jgi:hypothetical protein
MLRCGMPKKHRNAWSIQLPMLGALLTGHPTCGPCEQQAGKGVLIAIPVMLALGFLIQWSYRRCWTGLRQLTIFNSKSAMIMIGSGLALALVGVVAPHDGPNTYDDTFAAIIVVGASYVTWLALGLRLGLRTVAWNRYVLMFPIVIIAPVALLLALVGTHQELSDSLLGFFALPGMIGMIAGPMLLLLMAEPLLLHYRARRKKRLSEQLPKARVL